MVDSGRLGHAPGIDVDVRVIAEHRHAKPDQRLRVLDVEVGDDQLGLVERRLGQRRRERGLMARRRQHALDLAAQQKVG